MRHPRFALLSAAAALLAGSTALAQSNIVDENKFAWAENLGWLNWRDANDAEQGVLVSPASLSGYVWAENAGWINLGDGDAPYMNTNGSNFGVNIDANGDLFGLAWGENIGWINFDTRDELGPFDQQARFDSDAARFRGYAWAENAGWINLDDATHFVSAFGCPKDIAENDGVVNAFDLANLLTTWGPVDPDSPADFNGDGVVNAFDLAELLTSWGPCF